MTVVTYLRLNGDSGLAVADSRMTNRFGGSERTIDDVTKLSVVGNAVLGGSGAAGYFDEVVRRTDPKAVERFGPDAAKALAATATGYLRQLIEDNVLSRYGLTFDDVIRGSDHLDPSVRDEVRQHIQSFERSWSSDALYAGNKDGFKMFHIPSSGGAAEYPSRFASTGSGSDLADALIRRELERYKEAERNDLPLGAGVRILFDATRAGWRNAGVGGVTSCYLIDKDRAPVAMPRAASNIIQNAVGLAIRREVPEAFVEELAGSAFAEKPEALYDAVVKQVGLDKLAKALMVDGLSTSA